jgi:peptidoglycan/xylan/chitin deacetylase (PgdA/CDA1 family)
MNNIGRAAGSFTKPVPLAAAPAKSLPQYRSEFGTPLEVKPPVVASQPQTPGALSAPAKSNSAKPSSAPRIAYNHSNNVHAILRHPGVQAGNHATAAALPQIASYPSGQGYESGATLPYISSGSGMGSSANLSGVLLNKTRHH